MRPVTRLCGLVLLAALCCGAYADETLILPHPALARAQQLLRQAEQEGAATRMPVVVLSVQHKINAAWSAYHRQVEEEADQADDEEAVVARQLAEEAEVDAELLKVSLRTLQDEARLDGLRASLGLPVLRRMVVPPPDAPTVGGRP